MFKSLEHLVFVGAVVYLIGVFSCIKEVLSGKAKPNKVTWLLCGRLLRLSPLLLQ